MWLAPALAIRAREQRADQLRPTAASLAEKGELTSRTDPERAVEASVISASKRLGASGDGSPPSGARRLASPLRARNVLYAWKADAPSISQQARGSRRTHGGAERATGRERGAGR